jgi:hypothetical protein
MDLVFDIELSAESRPEHLATKPGSHRSDASAVAVARWYDWGYDAAPGQLGVDRSAFLAADTVALLAYWWGAQDAAQGRPRRDIL